MSKKLVMHMTDPTFIEESTSPSFKVVQIGKAHQTSIPQKKGHQIQKPSTVQVDQTTIYKIHVCVCVTFTHLLHQIKSFLNVKHALF